MAFANEYVSTPRFYGSMDPVHPCREMPTRHCPAIYQSVCGDRPCARFESEDETPWIPELDSVAVIVPRGDLYGLR